MTTEPVAILRGIVEGLEDNGDAQSATSVFVNSSSLGYGIGEAVGLATLGVNRRKRGLLC